MMAGVLRESAVFLAGVIVGVFLGRLYWNKLISKSHTLQEQIRQDIADKIR